MIRDLLQRFGRRAEGVDSVQSLLSEVEQLREQNEKLRAAMRHCIDCEYRTEVMARRATDGRTASGSNNRQHR